MTKLFLIISIIYHSPLIIIAQNGQSPVRIIPERVDFCMGSRIEENIRYPILSFKCYAGSFDDWASELILSRKDIGDTAIIDILGYDYVNHTQYLKEQNLVMTFSLRHARGTISLCFDYTNMDLPKYLIINLNSIKNQFEVISENLKVTLVPNRLINIDPFYKYKYFDPLEIFLVPSDVFIVYLFGNIQYDIDYTPCLIEFCQKKGFFLARDKYPQIPSNIGQYQMLVFSDENIPIKKSTSILLGHLEDYPDVNVNLKLYSDFNGF